jgi:hypothetical protein
MKKMRYREEQSAFALKQAEGGAPVSEMMHKRGITEPTFYMWRKPPNGSSRNLSLVLRDLRLLTPFSWSGSP